MNDWPSLRVGHKQAILARNRALRWRRPQRSYPTLTLSLPFGRTACAAIAVFALVLPGIAPARAQAPYMIRVSSSGNYLAARHAGTERDASAAANYYRAALRNDPKNGDILGRAFLSVLAAGDVDEAIKLAERSLQIDKNDRVAHLVLGVRSLKLKQYAAARAQFAQSVRGPITDLAATLLGSWALMGANDSRNATDGIDKLTGPDWYAIFKDLHAGLILDSAGQKKEAGKRLERAYKLDPSALRVVEAYGSWLSRNGAKDQALTVFDAFDQVLPRHPLITEEIAAVKDGKTLPALIDSPQAGAAEVLYGLGAALGRRGGEDLGLIYLQLALYLSPSHPLALLSLADLYEAVKKSELAIKTYERMPASSPLYRNAQIQLALNYDALDRGDEAKKHLEKLIVDRPNDLEAIMALGNVLRGRKQFAECAEIYSKAVSTIGIPAKPNWVVFYFRGICYERSKQWPKAEADMRKALELYPEQPQVLNYLGYSWIDQGINLEDGMRMIRRAVEQRPDDGYIVDSLGWAYFRTGNIEESVKQLERAVELKPEDPTINDHLGDAYWRTGRELEARFQWSHARDLKPEPDDLAKIEEKMKSGLGDGTSSAADADKPRPGGGG
jgi:tetratricopeptide (TPR) repeat protein